MRELFDDIDGDTGVPQEASHALEEMFMQHGIRPRPFTAHPTFASLQRAAHGVLTPPVLSEATKEFLRLPCNHSFSPESFRPREERHLTCGCCDPRLNVDIAAPGAGITDQGFIQYVKCLAARGYTIDVQTHDDCKAGLLLASESMLYHPDDMSRLYGSILAAELGVSHTHVTPEPLEEDSYTIYLDPTGRLGDPTLSGLPRGFKLTVSRDNLDVTVPKKIARLFGMATTIPDLGFVLHHGVKKSAQSSCIVVVDDGSNLADRTFECAEDTVSPIGLWFRTRVVRMAVPD